MLIVLAKFSVKIKFSSFNVLKKKCINLKDKLFEHSKIKSNFVRKIFSANLSFFLPNDKKFHQDFKDVFSFNNIFIISL